MERQKFEDSFQDIFRNAEEEPSSSVWTNIELDLERLEGGKMKKRVLFYQWVAAASIFFAVASAGAFYYYTSVSNSENNALAKSPLKSESDEKGNIQLKDSDISNTEAAEEGKANTTDDKEYSESLAQRTPDQKGDGNLQSKGINELNAKSQEKITSGKELTQNAIAQHQVSGDQYQTKSPIGKSKLPIGQTNNGDNDVSFVDENSILIPFNAFENSTTDELASFRNKNLSPLYVSQPVELSLPEEDKVKADPGQLLLQRLAYEEKILNADKEEKTKKDERIWTSVGFAAGSFSNVGSGSADRASNSPTFQNSIFSRSSVSNEAQPNGSSYSFGVNVGGKIANRWTLQGGINYLTQSSDYTSNALIVADQNYVAPALVENKNVVQSLDFAKFVTTPEYSINNNLQFFSLPVMAGYLIVDRDFGWQLSTGISTDLFIQNVLTPDNENLNKSTSGRGDESPYRPFNLSGLVGTEFSYRVANRYRIALNPGIRYPFNSIYKSEVGISTTPLTFDVALKFKYIFQ